MSRSLAFAISFLPPAFFFLHYCSKRSNQKLNLIFIAQEIEKTNPQLENNLVSHLLSKSKNSHSAKRLAAEMDKLKVNSIEFSKTTTITTRVLASLLFISALYSISSVRSIPLSLARLYVPFVDAPAPSKTQFSKISPKNNSTIFVEQDWTLTINTSGLQPENGKVRLFNSDDKYEDFELILDQENTYIAKLPASGKEANYKIFLGDAESSVRNIEFKRQPIIKTFNIKAVSPGYLGNRTKRVSQKNFSVIAGSHINFDLLFDQKIKHADIYWNGQVIPLYTNFDRVNNLNLLQVARSTEYWIRYQGFESEKYFYTPKHRISVVSDKAPRAIITSPEHDSEYAYNEDIPIYFTCEDDLSIDSIFLTYDLRYSKIRKTIKLKNLLSVPSFSGSYTLSPQKMNIKGDEILTLSLSVTDFKRKDKPVISEAIRIFIKGPRKNSQSNKSQGLQKEYGKGEEESPSSEDKSKNNEEPTKPEGNNSENIGDKSENEMKAQSEKQTENGSKEQGEGKGQGEAKGQSEGEAKGQGEGEAKGQGEGEAKGQGEGEAKGQGEGEAKGQGEGEGEAKEQGEGKGEAKEQGEGKESNNIEATEKAKTNQDSIKANNESSQAERSNEKEKLELKDAEKKATTKLKDTTLKDEQEKVNQTNTDSQTKEGSTKVDSSFKLNESELKKEKDDIKEEQKKSLSEDEREIVDEFKKEVKKLKRTLKN